MKTRILPLAAALVAVAFGSASSADIVVLQSPLPVIAQDDLKLTPLPLPHPMPVPVPIVLPLPRPIPLPDTCLSCPPVPLHHMPIPRVMILR